MADRIESVQAIIGHVFNDSTLCYEALGVAGHPGGFPVTAQGRDGNASLALLGDGILRIGVALQSRENHESKGQASDRMQSVVNNHNLACIFDEAGLFDYVLLNPSQQGMIAHRTKATVVEALIGAVFCDADVSAALAVMRRLNFR